MNRPKQNGDFVEDSFNNFDIFRHFVETISLNNAA
jgi:hypothetical protein